MWSCPDILYLYIFEKTELKAWLSMGPKVCGLILSLSVNVSEWRHSHDSDDSDGIYMALIGSEWWVILVILVVVCPPVILSADIMVQPHPNITRGRHYYYCGGGGEGTLTAQIFALLDSGDTSPHGFLLSDIAICCFYLIWKNLTESMDCLHKMQTADSDSDVEYLIFNINPNYRVVFTAWESAEPRGTCRAVWPLAS